MKEITIKNHPELRHVFAHLALAMDSLANGHPADAMYELQSIHGLIFFDSDEEQVRVAERRYGKWPAKKASAAKARKRAGSNARGRNRSGGSRP